MVAVQKLIGDGEKTELPEGCRHPREMLEQHPLVIAVERGAEHRERPGERQQGDRGQDEALG